MIKSSNSPLNIDYIIQDLECKLNDKIKSYDICNCLFLVAASMIAYYGKKHKFCIYKAILNTEYIIDNGEYFQYTHTLRDVLGKNINEYHSNNVTSICDIKNDINNNYKANYTLFITNRYTNKIDLLEGLIREINKIFLSDNHMFILEENKIYIRNGIYKKELETKSNKESRKAINDIIINLQIEDMLKIIKSFEYSGTNDNLSKLLKNIKKYDMDNIVLDCCLPLVNLFRPLFDIEYIKKLLKTNMYEGTIDNIQQEFDSVLGTGSFDKMSKKLDKLYDDFYYGNLGGNISEYTISKEYISIRDNFIKKYIQKKYA